MRLLDSHCHPIAAVRAGTLGPWLEQVKAAGLPEKWKDWGTGFINTSRWLEICFNSLAKK